VAVLLSYLLTSLFFGLLHANNAKATLVSSLELTLFGMLVGLGFILTGELAVPIGIHVAWNFA
jgi:membrane protease YdiL (CAAX protease family)